jgi:hypothetical protein
MKYAVVRHVIAAGSLLAGMLVAGAASAQSPWTSIGSAGIVDEADATEVRYGTTAVDIQPTAAASSSVRIRYNVTATSDLEEGVNKAMTVRYRDNGPNARVFVFLYRTDIDTGALSTVLSFDSDTRPQSTSYQTGGDGDGCWADGFDFHNYTYHIEVVLQRTSAAGTPTVTALAVADHDIC